MRINTNADIHIQQDAVVSKTILKNDGGTVTLFAFDGGQTLSEHTAPFDALFHCLDGDFLVTIDNEKHQLKKDEILLLPASIPHSVIAVTPSKCLLIMIKSKK